MNWIQKICQRQSELQLLVERWRSILPDLIFFASEDDNKIILNNLIVPKNQRKQGIGTKIMQDLIAYADKIGKRIELSPGVKDLHHGTTSRNRLIGFYKRFGFKENKGRHKDYTMNEYMFRNPTKKNDSSVDS